MAYHIHINADGLDPELKVTIADDDVFEDCNFVQLTKRPIFAGFSNLSFVDCNLNNCILPAGSRVKGSAECELTITDEDVTDEHGRPDRKRTTEFISKISNTQLTDRQTEDVLKPYEAERKRRKSGKLRWTTKKER